MNLKRILIAQSDHDVATFIADVVNNLGGNGVWPAITTDTDYAIEAIRRYDLALVITGIRFNNDSAGGLAIIGEAKKKSPPPKIMVCSCFVGRDEAYSSAHYGSDDCITKPFDVEKMNAKISALLGLDKPAEHTAVVTS